MSLLQSLSHFHHYDNPSMDNLYFSLLSIISLYIILYNGSTPLFQNLRRSQARYLEDLEMDKLRMSRRYMYL